MKKIDIQLLEPFINIEIQKFHDNRLAKLSALELIKTLKKKNPYLYKAKNINVAADLVKNIVDAFLQLQEESLFGTFLESLAVFICGQTLGGFKSTNFEGIDLEFQHNNAYYIVEIKSGPNWGNSSQLKKMEQNFANAKIVLQAKYPNLPVIAVNGCCYGKDNQPDKKTYFKYCGQVFWELISDDSNLYLDIIEPLGYKAKAKNDAFEQEYAKVVNKFTAEFIQLYCDAQGLIDWKKLTALVSIK